MFNIKFKLPNIRVRLKTKVIEQILKNLTQAPFTFSYANKVYSSSFKSKINEDLKSLKISL